MSRSRRWPEHREADAWKLLDATDRRRACASEPKARTAGAGSPMARPRELRARARRAFFGREERPRRSRTASAAIRS